MCPREHVVHGPRQLLRQHGQRFALAVFAFQLGEVALPELVLAQEEHGGFREGPLELRVANLLARKAAGLASPLLGTFDEPAVGEEVTNYKSCMATSFHNS